MPMFIRKFWPSKLLKTRTSAFIIASFISAAVLAVELDQLHLPRTYIRYLPNLLDGGRLMAASERCEQFITGQLNLDSSTLEHPVFRYTCRDAQDQTYSWHVDGLTYEVLDSTRPEGRIAFAQLQAEIDQARALQRQRELEEAAEIAALQQDRERIQMLREQELQRQAEELARLQEIARRERLWRDCQNDLAQQTRNMLEQRWLTENQPEAEALDEERFRFVVDFNARDPHGTALEFRAYCIFGVDSDAMHISIHPRALELQKQE